MSRSRSEGPTDPVVFGAIAVLAGVGLLVWAWGGVAGALFGRGWPRMDVSALLSVLARLPRRLSDPASAWPRNARGLLPGAAGVYAALAVVLAGAGAAVLVALRVLGPIGLQGGPGAGRRGGARWASGWDLRQLRSGPGSRRFGRLVLGRHGARLLYAEKRHALVAFGPPQSGKSAGLAVPALLEWDGPAVASSIKTDLLGATIRRRQELGTVFVFDPFSLAGVPAQTWSPLQQARSWDGALEVAWRLAAAGELDRRSVEGGDFWSTAAEQRLAPLLFTAARSDAGIESVVRWVNGQGGRELDEALAQVTGEAADASELADAHAAYDSIRAFEAQADRTRSSIEATAQALLRAYRFTRVARSAAGCEITADRLLDERATLYLIGDAKASKLLRPLFLALLSEVVDRAYERATLAGGALELPLLLCLDEAGNVAPLPNLAEVATTAPSHNIQLISIFHDLAQARSRYGQQAETVINSHRARMLLPGVADLETLRLFAGLIGEAETRELTRTTGSSGSSRSTGTRRRALVAAEELRQLPAGQALLLYGRLAPVIVHLRMWFRDRKLRTMGRLMSSTDGDRRRWEEAGEVGDSGFDGPEPEDDEHRFDTCGPSEQGGWEDLVLPRWPLDWRELLPRERWLWFAQLWEDTCRLRERYRLGVRTEWWQDSIQVEALAALVAWVDRYDSGEWEDPPGKLALLYELERVNALLRDGSDPFQPRRDQPTFLRHLLDIGCQPPNRDEIDSWSQAPETDSERA